MKKFGLLFILLISFLLFSETVVSEMESKLETLSGRKKVEALVQLAEHYQKEEPHKSLQYANQAIELTQQTDWHKERISALKSSAFFYQKQGQHFKAIDHYQQGLNIAKEKKIVVEIAAISRLLGDMYLAQQKFTEALDQYSIALENYQTANNKPEISYVFDQIGLVYWRWNQFSQALDYHQQALNLNESLQDTLAVGRSLNSIGNVYLKLNRYDEALENFNKALIIFDKIDDKHGTANCFNSIGDIYKQQNDDTKALDYYIRALKIREHLQDNIGIASSFNNLGVIYQIQKSYRLANDYFSQSNKIYQELGDNAGIATTLSNMGRNDLLENKYDAAIRKVNESNLIAERDNLLMTKMENFDILSRVYAARGDFRNALVYFKTFSELKDSFFNEELKKITEIKLDYETQRKDREIHFLRQEMQIIELQLAAQKANLRTLVILFIVSFVLLLIILQRYLHHKKEKVELIKQADQLKAVAKTDSLTKISNKNDLMEHLEMEQKRFARNQKSFVIMVADLDDFTRINEQYGKQAGDFVLRYLSNMIRRSIRRHDLVGRWEGQQFLMILPETDLQGGQIISEKIRKKVSTNPCAYKDVNIYITVTIGLTIYTKETDIETLIGKAENALATGKQRGKNCVIISST
jgi:diguanylate cyclase (GGDEF)-like protein